MDESKIQQCWHPAGKTIRAEGWVHADGSPCFDGDTLSRGDKCMNCGRLVVSCWAGNGRKSDAD